MNLKKILKEEILKYTLEEAVDNFTQQYIKRAYVSIRYNENVIKNLVDHKLEGIRGISTSKYNVSNWFVHRDILLVMPFDAFEEMNNCGQIIYDDPYKLMQNDMLVFYRLYDRKTQSNVERDRAEIISRLLPKIKLEIDLLATYYHQIDLNLSKNFYKIADYLDIYNSSKFTNYLAKKVINTPEEICQGIIDYFDSPDGYYYSGVEKVITMEHLIEPVKQGIVKAASVYKDESEWEIYDQILHIPKGTHIFIRKDIYGGENINKDIEDHNLKAYFKFNFVSQQSLNNYSNIQFKKQRDKFNSDFGNKKESYQIQKNEIIKGLKTKFIEDFTNYLPTIFAEYNPYDEGYIIDPDGEYVEVDEPYIFSEPFKEKTKNVLKKLSQIWDNNAPLDQPVTEIDKYYFSGILWRMEDAIKAIKYEDREEVNGLRLKSSRYDIEPSSFYQMLVATLEHTFKPEEYLTELKEQLGADIYRVYGKEIKF